MPHSPDAARFRDPWVDDNFYLPDLAGYLRAKVSDLRQRFGIQARYRADSKVTVIVMGGRGRSARMRQGFAGDCRSYIVSNDVFIPSQDGGATNDPSHFGRMTSMQPGGIEAVFMANRQKLLGFLVARGAGDAAEDLVQDLWLKITGSATGPIANPLSYLYRAAHTLMIDRYRSRTRGALRDGEWLESESESEIAGASPEPVGERVIAGRQEVERVAATLAGLGPRREAVFRRVRIDGIQQRQIAAELGISLSTVESDLRIACRALAGLKEDLA